MTHLSSNRKNIVITSSSTSIPNIQFTIEEPSEDGALPFQDALISLDPYNTLVPLVYRKPTHMDQNLHWDSNHFLLAKYSVYKTMAQGAMVVCTSGPTLQQENEHIGQALSKYTFTP